MTPPNSPALTILRALFSVLFFLLLWVHWGWGSALAAGLVLVATGAQGEKRSVFVPVPGSIRVAIELVYGILGMVVAYGVLGSLWGTVISIAYVFISVLSIRQYRYILTLR